MKVCSKCNENKELSEFYGDKNFKDGFRSICKQCDKKKASNWNKSNPKQHQDHQSKWRTNNRQASRDQANNYGKSDKGKISKTNWLSNNRDKLNATVRKWQKKQSKCNPLYKIRRITASLLYKAISRRGYKKDSNTATMLGCSWIDFKNYIESKFYPNPITGESMSWDNYGKNGWEVDHIVSCCTSNSLEELKVLQHYLNLQPLWKEDHKEKTKNDVSNYWRYSLQDN